MNIFADEELNYVSVSVKKGVRIDCREFIDKRNQEIFDIDIPQCDRAIRIIREFSIVDLKIGFRMSKKSLEKIGSLDDLNENSEVVKSRIEIVPNVYITIQSNFFHKNPVFEAIDKILDEHSIGILIEIDVLKNDGNIFDMIFDGLNHIFSCIEIPNINDLNYTNRCCFSFPVAETYCIFENISLKDPTLIEEFAADGIVHVFKDNDKIVSIITENNIQFNIFLDLLNKL